jgi:sodium transport system permease protein
MGGKLALSVALIPILNASLIIKQALNGNYNFAFIGLAFAASVVYAGLSLAIATRMFQNENVLIKA